MSHEAKITPVDEKFDALAKDVYSSGCRGKLPELTLGTQIEWAENLVVNEVSTGVYHGDFDGKLPFYFVDMKPDPRFSGPETTAIFLGTRFYPLSLGYIFDTTVHEFVARRSRNVNTDKDDIRKWTASKLGNAVHENELSGGGQTILEQISGISSNARQSILEGFEDLASQLKEPSNSVGFGQLLKKTITFSLRGYLFFMLIGILVLIISNQSGNTYAINWDIVGFSLVMQMIVRLAGETINKGIFYSMYFIIMALPFTFILLGFFKTLFAGPKPWSIKKLLKYLILFHLACVGIFRAYILHLPQESYYVFPENYTVGYFSIILSELVGVVSMVPEILMVSAVLAYLRIRKVQDDDVVKTLDEIESPTLKRQLGFSES